MFSSALTQVKVKPELHSSWWYCRKYCMDTTNKAPCLKLELEQVFPGKYGRGDMACCLKAKYVELFFCLIHGYMNARNSCFDVSKYCPLHHQHVCSCKTLSSLTFLFLCSVEDTDLPHVPLKQALGIFAEWQVLCMQEQSEVFPALTCVVSELKHLQSNPARAQVL